MSAAVAWAIIALLFAGTFTGGAFYGRPMLRRWWRR